MSENAYRWSIAAFASLALAIGCSHSDGDGFNPIDLVVPDFSDDDLREIGMDADREIQQQVEIIYDPIVSGYLNELGQELASQIAPQPFIYRFRVINAKDLKDDALRAAYVARADALSEIAVTAEAEILRQVEAILARK